MIIAFAVLLSLNPILFSSQSYSEGFQFSMKPCKLKIGFYFRFVMKSKRRNLLITNKKLATINKAEILPKLLVV